MTCNPICNSLSLPSSDRLTCYTESEYDGLVAYCYLEQRYGRPSPACTHAVSSRSLGLGESGLKQMHLGDYPPCAANQPYCWQQPPALHASCYGPCLGHGLVLLLAVSGTHGPRNAVKGSFLRDALVSCSCSTLASLLLPQHFP